MKPSHTRVAKRFLRANVSSNELDQLFYALQKELGDASKGRVSGLDEEDLEIRRGGVLRFRYHQYDRGRANYKAIKEVIEFIAKRKGYQTTFLDNQWKTGYYNLQISRI